METSPAELNLNFGLFVLVLVFSMAVLGAFGLSIRVTKKEQRVFFSIVSVIAFAMLLGLPVLNDPNKFGWIQVWWAYMLLFMAPFEWFENGFMRLLLVCIGVATMHTVISLLIGAGVTKFRYRTKTKSEPGEVVNSE